jgi:FkbM family methyltransferase
VVIDIGANVGAHALLAAHLVGPTGRVHAVEASPRIFAMLQEDLRLNGASNVMEYNVAVSDVAGSVPVYVHDESNLGGTRPPAPDLVPVREIGRELTDIVFERD